MTGSFKIHQLTIASVLAFSVATFGTLSALPSFMASVKDYNVTNEYRKFDLQINYVDKKPEFYEQAAAHLRPTFPDFKFTPEPTGLRFSHDDAAEQKQVNFIVSELKALEPGVYWSVSNACLGSTCQPKILFKLTAKTLKIDTKES